MPRDLHRKPFNDATLAKLEPFQKHIRAWLGVFVGSGRVTKRKIRIFDLFCGPGKDSAGHKGTPILILEALQSLAAKINDAGYQVEVFCNDADEDKIIELQENIAELGVGAGPCALHLSSKDFAVIFDELSC
jgi:three-Cys-motif partner protein